MKLRFTDRADKDTRAHWCAFYSVRWTEPRFWPQKYARLDSAATDIIVEPMEVHFRPDVEARLKALASDTGRNPDELVQDAVAAHLDELADVRRTLASRYDDLKSGRVKLIDGEEAFARLRQKMRARAKTDDTAQRLCQP